MNNKNIFTINSQPVVNCKPSDDHFVGWGPINGFVFQRFYIEFFIDRTKLNKLIEYYSIYHFEEKFQYDKKTKKGVFSLLM